MPDGDKSFSDYLVLDLRIWWRLVACTHPIGPEFFLNQKPITAHTWGKLRFEHWLHWQCCDVVIKCCDGLAGACKCWANNVAVCCVDMLRSFGRARERNLRWFLRVNTSRLNLDGWAHLMCNAENTQKSAEQVNSQHFSSSWQFLIKLKRTELWQKFNLSIFTFLFFFI